MCSSGRGQLLLPWPNRIEDGKFNFEGGPLQLPLTEPGLHNAIHGLTRWVDWTVLDRDESSVRMGYALRPQPGYPFGLDLSTWFNLDRDGLTVTMEATNVGESRCPFGAGAHPYLSAGGNAIDGDRLTVAAEAFLVANDRQIPIETRAAEGTENDFREGKPIGNLVLDTCFTQLRRDGEGKAWVSLAGAGGGRTSLWLDDRFPYVMVFSGDTVHPTSRRRRCLAVEPMSCAPNAFNSGEGLLVLGPGESFRGSWGITAG
jgi:aldose 1-epimerase